MEIQKGEVLLIQSGKSFDERIHQVHSVFPLNSDIIVLKNKGISIEDVREFQDNFQKTSSEINDGFKKLGILIFDDISINASNALLKVLEDIDKENCIILYTNKNVMLLSTILSRVIRIDEKEDSLSNKKIEMPNPDDKDTPIDKQQVIEWITYKIETSKINKDKQPLMWINNPSPNIKYIIEYVNLFY